MKSGTLYRRSAFTNNPKGGNPAGVWVGDKLPSVDVMQRIAAEVGSSETAFVAPNRGPNRTIREFGEFGVGIWGGEFGNLGSDQANLLT
jgi:predicted PhzF superfamily epimerase YddE/YHI9